MELPTAFTDKMRALLGSESDDFFASLDRPSQKAITVNYSRIDRDTFEQLADFAHTPIPGISNGYYTDGLKVGSHILHHLGVIYSQEPSAMLPVEMLGIEENDYVLDISAAPGGKSIQILEKLNGTGVLVSNEIVYSRAKILYENLNRLGFRNFVITNNSPADYELTDLKFDKILVDAPCGGEGMIRKSNFDMDAYNLSNIETNAKRQLSILNSVKDLLRRGGKLVYSTCTYDIRENEGVIAEFLKTNSDYHIVSPPAYFDSLTSPGIKIGDTSTELTKRRYPHLQSGEGQYMAILQRDGDDELSTDTLKLNGIQPVYRKDLHDIDREIKGVVNIDGLSLYKRNDTIFVVPNIHLDFGKLNIVSIGTVFGNLNKSNFKINHTFYHTYGERLTYSIELSPEQLDKYLRGEEIDVQTDVKGIVSVKYKHIPLGGGKVVNSRLKNYYPKELRL